MAWQAILLDIAPRDGRITFSILFAGDTRKFVREFSVDNLTSSNLKTLARNEVAALATAENSKPELIPLGPIDLTPDTRQDPDPASVARGAFLANWRLAQSYQRAIALSLVAPDDPTFVAIQTALTKYFLPSYLEAM